MRIVQITPGSGDNFYCENCLRDVSVVKAIRELGHDIFMVPLYLPIEFDGAKGLTDAPLFFGGVNVYLQQKSAIFRNTPRWVDRVFDSAKLLRWVGRKAGATSAAALGETTVSMLQGEQGRQKKELVRLIEWLTASENRPDIVCLSNVLLAGLAGAVKRKLGVPVLCLLQDEDAFLDGLMQPYAGQAWKVVAEQSKNIDAFISVSRYYAEVMQKRLGVSRDKMHVVYMGIALDEYPPVESRPSVPSIGYLSRLCVDKGLDTLVDAFVILKKNDKLKNAKLRLAGGAVGSDKVFVGKIKRRLDSCGVIGEVEFLSDFSHKARLDFLKTLSVLSVPEKKPTAFGLYVIEALAMGVPVVEPAIGAFAELLESTGGGLLYEPDGPKALAAALQRILLDADYALEIGERGREAVSEKFTVQESAREMVRICEEVAP